ncbi:MAG: glutamine--fructose-6-phosphate transaminase (isomerizing) [Clostridia bacterium]|nr:glutamine--fructose-6-phosphate transaminase (isomerizing) [Clostridia bacterium]
MCGIVGYIGNKASVPFLLNGLSKLEYRGYDSAGIAVLTDDNQVCVRKAKGRLSVLSDKISGENISGGIGIGHTRWATHGEPSDVNSHPHTSNRGDIAVVHNGIIENYAILKEKLISRGYEFVSETDTEVVSHLLDYYYKGDMIDAIIKLTEKLEGSYALGIISAAHPGEMFAVRKDSPLIVGIGENENYIASDIPAVLEYTRDVYLLEDKEIVHFKGNEITILDTDKTEIKKDVFHIDWDVSAAEKGGYEHFMFKEIMEQPTAITNTVMPRIENGNIVLDNITISKEDIDSFNKIYIIGCGSAYHVGVTAKYFIEKLARIPVDVELASEFRYRNPIINKNDLIIIISQSGETADTLAALREAKKQGARILSVVNVVGSSIARESDDVLYTWAGPEIAVATTKAYSTQMQAMYLIGLYFAKMKGTVQDSEFAVLIDELSALPSKLQQVLDNMEQISSYASKHYNAKDVFFLGRGLDYCTCLEGSLKLKEISYIHSEAYAAGELKHGTISLIEDGTLVVSLATQSDIFDKMVSNIKEVKTRGAVVFSIAQEGNTAIESESDFVYYIPKTLDIFAPALTVVPLQVFAYYMAVNKGCDVDKPRNLAKSVTVE